MTITFLFQLKNECNGGTERSGVTKNINFHPLGTINIHGRFEMWPLLFKETLPSVEEGHPDF